MVSGAADRARLARWLATFAVLLLTCGAFAPALDNQFVNWDDDHNFVQNRHWLGFSAENVRWMLTTRHLGNYQPLSWLSLGLDHELWGSGPIGPHAGNLAYHALCALAVFYVARRLFARASGLSPLECTLAAVAAALAFSVHPLRVESVAWATERRDVLSGLLLAATVLLYLQAAELEGAPRAWRLAAALAVYVLSLGAKAIGMTLPAVLLVLDVWPLGRARDARRLRACLAEKIFFLVPAAAAAWIALGGQAEVDAMLTAGQVGLADRLRIASFASVFYLAKTVWPAALWPHYSIPLDLDFGGARYALAPAAVLAISAAAVLLRRRLPALPAAWLAYLAFLAPVSGVTLAGRQVAADRYTYLPGIVLGLCAGGLVLLGERRLARGGRTALRAGTAALLLVLAARTAFQCEVWSDSETLWRHVILHQPDSVPGRNNLADVLTARGADHEALEHYEAAVRLAPAERAVHLNVGLCYEKLGRHEEALASVRRAAALDPDLWNARFFLGTRLLERGELTEATLHLERAAALDPDFTPGRIALVRALVEADRADEAAQRIEELLGLAGLRPAQHQALADFALAVGRRDLARRVLEEGLRAHPGDPDLVDRLKKLGG